MFICAKVEGKKIITKNKWLIFINYIKHPQIAKGDITLVKTDNSKDIITLTGGSPSPLLVG